MVGIRTTAGCLAGLFIGILAGTSAAAAANASVFTPLGDGVCKVTHIATRDPGGEKLKPEDAAPDRWRCPGYRGTDVLIAFDDEREGIAFGRHGRPTGSYLFHGHFGSWRPSVEWRGPAVPGGVAPRAAIVHYKWDIPDDPTGVDHGDDIVIIRLGSGATPPCILAKIDAGANPEATAMARAFVDDVLPGRSCEAGQSPESLGKTR